MRIVLTPQALYLARVLATVTAVNAFTLGSSFTLVTPLALIGAWNAFRPDLEERTRTGEGAMLDPFAHLLNRGLYVRLALTGLIYLVTLGAGRLLGVHPPSTVGWITGLFLLSLSMEGLRAPERALF